MNKICTFFLFLSLGTLNNVWCMEGQRPDDLNDGSDNESNQASMRALAQSLPESTPNLREIYCGFLNLGSGASEQEIHERFRHLNERRTPSSSEQVAYDALIALLAGQRDTSRQSDRNFNPMHISSLIHQDSTTNDQRNINSDVQTQDQSGDLDYRTIFDELTFPPLLSQASATANNSETAVPQRQSGPVLFRIIRRRRIRVRFPNIAQGRNNQDDGNVNNSTLPQNKN